ncbi:hypothetical protein TrispH2_011226 [Trichoplax sp. H2]|nr:hypothetical protein TrispH2_011226 [Trichoplax sp. H2]|eukprot:RDD36952.1 hypothetical protein TrispH2_011226 [Trichoplax sp. H2]
MSSDTDENFERFIQYLEFLGDARFRIILAAVIITAAMGICMMVIRLRERSKLISQGIKTIDIVGDTGSKSIKAEINDKLGIAVTVSTRREPLFFEDADSIKGYRYRLKAINDEIILNQHLLKHNRRVARPWGERISAHIYLLASTYKKAFKNRGHLCRAIAVKYEHARNSKRPFTQADYEEWQLLLDKLKQIVRNK